MSMSITKVTQGPPVTPVSGNAVEQEAVVQEHEAVNDETKQEKTSGIDKEKIEKAVEQFNAAGEYFGNHIELQVHEETQRYMIDIVDKETKQIISEFPPEEVLDLVARFKDMMGVVISGLFLDKKV